MTDHDPTNGKTPAPKGYSQGSRQTVSEQQAIETSLAVAVQLLAPPTMSVQARLDWIKAAIAVIDKLSIRADEVEGVMPSIMADGIRMSLIIHEISKRVTAKRASRYGVSATYQPSQRYQIEQEAQRRRGQARTQAEIEDAFQWEQDAYRAAGLPTFTGYVPWRRGHSIETLHALSKHPVHYRAAKDLGQASPEMFAEVDALNARGVPPSENPTPAALAVDSLPGNRPLTRYELDRLPADIAKMGLSSGFLKRVDGKLEEVIQ